MKKLERADAFIARWMPCFVLFVVFLGISFPDTFSPLNRITVPLFFCTTFANSLGGGFRDLLGVFRHPLPVVLVLLVLHVVMPLAALGLGNLLFPDAPLFTIGLVLEYCVPVGVATLMWSGIASGNIPLCLSLVLLVVFAVSVKAALPDLPLKEILRPGTVVFILAAALVLGLADLVLPTVWQGYDARTQLVWRAGATCLLAFVCCAALSRQGTSPVNKADAAPEKPRRTEVEQAAMALADSVCPPKR